MLIVPKRILVLALHAGDAEFGAGGLITKWLEAGVDLHVTVFSAVEESLSSGSVPTWLADECHASLDVFGVKLESRQIMHYPVRKFGYHRQEVLESVVTVERRLNPEWILIPLGADLHRDYATIHDGAMRAFKHETLLGYEPPWNRITFPASAFVTLDKRHPDKKWDALTKYISQPEMGRAYLTKEFYEPLAKVHGPQVKYDWTKAFELIRIVL